MDNQDLSMIGGVILILLILLLLGSGVLAPPGEEGEEDDVPPGGIPCTNDDDCPEGMVCIGGYCQYPEDECTEDADCLGGFCVGGECVDCLDDEDCPPGEVCVNGECVEDNSCTTDEDCGPGEECVGGVCTDPCAAVDCPGDDVCVDGECVDEDCIGVECPEGEECIDGECVDEDCIGVECPPGEECIDGECVDEDCIGVECPEGEECIDGECTEVGELETPESFCEGCPSEDSLETRMFLDPDIPERTVSVALFAEVGTQRYVIEEGTVFAQVIANDLSSITTCKMLTDEYGEATFDYSENDVCKETGCLINLVFCCANIGDVCLLPLCLHDDTITSHSQIPACEPFGGAWPTQAEVVDHDEPLSPLFPAMDEISIPPEPKLLGLGFTFELCFPILAIFGLLSAAMFASGRNPFQLFSFYTPRFKRAPQRAIRARGFTLNISAIAGSIASAAQGLGGKDKDKRSTLSSRRSKFKGAVGKKGSRMSKKIRKAVKEGRSGKPYSSDSVPKGGDKGGVGARGPAASQMAEGAGSVDRLLSNAALSGDFLSRGGMLKSFFRLMGKATLSKLLGKYAFTSWIVYGGGREGGFKGLFDLIDEKAKARGAPKVFANCQEIMKQLNWTETTNKDGSVTVSYNNPDNPDERITRTFSNDKKGMQDLLELRGEIYNPTVVIMNAAAKSIMLTSTSMRGEIMEAMEKFREEQAERLGLTLDAGEEPEEGGENRSLDNIRAQGKEWYAKGYEKVVAGMIPSDRRTLRRIRKGKESLADQKKFTASVEALEKKVGKAEKAYAQGKKGVVPEEDLSRAAAMVEKLEAEFGAEFVASDPTARKLTNLLARGSEVSVNNAKPGTQLEGALHFRNYSRSLLGSIAIESGNMDVAQEHVGALEASAAAAGQGEEGRIIGSDLVVAAAMLEKANSTLGPKGVVRDETLTRLSSALVAGSQAYADTAPPEHKAEALNFQMYSASLVGTIAAKGGNPGLAQQSMLSLSDGYQDADAHIKQTFKDTGIPSDDQTRNLMTTVSNFGGEADPRQYSEALSKYNETDALIQEHATSLTKYGMPDDGSKYYIGQRDNTVVQAATDKYREEYSEYREKAADNLYGRDERKKYEAEALPSAVAAKNQKALGQTEERMAAERYGGKKPSELTSEQKAEITREAERAVYGNTLRATEDKILKEDYGGKTFGELTRDEQIGVRVEAKEQVQDSLSRDERKQLETYAMERFARENAAAIEAAAGGQMVQDINSGAFKPSDSTEAREKREQEMLSEEQKRQQRRTYGPVMGKDDEATKRFSDLQADAAARYTDEHLYAPAKHFNTLKSGAATAEERQRAIEGLRQFHHGVYMDGQVPAGSELPKPSRVEAQIRADVEARARDPTRSLDGSPSSGTASTPTPEQINERVQTEARQYYNSLSQNPKYGPEAANMAGIYGQTPVGQPPEPGKPAGVSTSREPVPTSDQIMKQEGVNWKANIGGAINSGQVDAAEQKMLELHNQSNPVAGTGTAFASTSQDLLKPLPGSEPKKTEAEISAEARANEARLFQDLAGEARKRATSARGPPGGGEPPPEGGTPAAAAKADQDEAAKKARAAQIADDARRDAEAAADAQARKAEADAAAARAQREQAAAAERARDEAATARAAEEAAKVEKRSRPRRQKPPEPSPGMDFVKQPPEYEAPKPAEAPKQKEYKAPKPRKTPGMKGVEERELPASLDQARQDRIKRAEELRRFAERRRKKKGGDETA